MNRSDTERKSTGEVVDTTQRREYALNWLLAHRRPRGVVGAGSPQRRNLYDQPPGVLSATPKGVC